MPTSYAACSHRRPLAEDRPPSFHCVEPEDLFPSAVLAVETPEISRRLDGVDLAPLLSAHHQRLLEGPDATIERVELHERVNSVLQTLTPREAEMLRLRFGLDDGEERTQGEIGAVYGVSYGRVRQIELKALRKLRHPTRAKRLRGFLPDGRRRSAIGGT